MSYDPHNFRDGTTLYAAQLNDMDSALHNLENRVSALEYVPIEISSFSATPSVAEKGSSVTVNLTWSLNKTATSQQIDGVMVTGTSKQYSNVTSDRSYTLSVTDGQTTKSKSVSVSFANQIYYGASTNIDNITSLSKTLSNTKTRTITVNASTDEYIIYAIPARLGTVRFFSGGFEGGFEDAEKKQITNSSGYTETYDVYRSSRSNLGATTVEIKEVS